MSSKLLDEVKEKLKNAGYDGSLLKTNDLLLAIDDKGDIMKMIPASPKSSSVILN